MSEIQQISLEILKKITDICDREGFRYYLIYGTLIGAVRHRGFIPWDDDVDIIMPRPDHTRLFAFLKEHTDLLEVLKLKVFSRENVPGYKYGIPRICDTRYIISTSNERDCGMGVFIDVYPLDGLGNSYEEAVTMMRESSFWLHRIANAIKKHIEIPRALNIKGKIVFMLNRFRDKLLGVKYLFAKQSKSIRKYNYSDSEYVGPVQWYFTKPEKVVFDKSIFEERIKLPFEKYEFYVPREYDRLLTQEYGDYMSFPPVEKRVYHHQYKAFRKD